MNLAAEKHARTAQRRHNELRQGGFSQAPGAATEPAIELEASAGVSARDLADCRPMANLLSSLPAQRPTAPTCAPMSLNGVLSRMFSRSTGHVRMTGRRVGAMFRGNLRRRLGWVALGLAGVIPAAGAPAASPSPAALNEYEIKAAAFYNIIAFTNWPSSAFASPDSPLVVGIVGDGPIASLIERVLRNETWRGRKIVLRQNADGRTVPICHVLFIARSQRANWAAIRAECHNHPILAVSDGDNFAAEGGNVQLAIEQRKLRILVNLAATRANGLQLSSNLLHLSTIVGPEPDPSDSPHSGLRPPPLEGYAYALAMLQ